MIFRKRGKKANSFKLDDMLCSLNNYYVVQSGGIKECNVFTYIMSHFWINVGFIFLFLTEN